MIQGKYFKYPVPSLPNSTTEGFMTSDLLEELSILKPQVHAYVEQFSEVLIRAELIVGDSNVAGQVDLPVISRIIDYKTDKKIEKSNRWQKFKYPLNHLDQCNYNKYALQLSLYKYMLELAGIVLPESNTIVHFHKDNPSYVEYELPYLRDEIVAMLNHKFNNTYK
jgi:hypothetical protein